MVEETDVYKLLHQRLVAGGFVADLKLQPEQLRKDYNCSASTIREALFRLSTVGVVTFKEQRGFRVPQVSRVVQHELTHMRILLECEGACLSIRLGGVAWEARLSAAHHKLSHIEMRARSKAELEPLFDLWSTAEQEFHETLIDACGSLTLKRTHSIIYQQFRQQLINADSDTIYVPENILQHQGILEAALDRDEDLLRRLIHDHLSRNLAQPLPEKKSW
ncbi:MAG: GntR family transcriptional regulator [Paracoccaceae bacterium]|jgi:DNA-binding GntR family transcriptional regulator|nr:GntR family transcriptional regulator [Paracoccaceae bacterium]|tara:strand:+ start:7687 stop:8346 length:660 start_codon:yes stop_codon:yes gene_type:complete